MIEAREEALQAVADELHDGLIQYLMATQAHLEMFRLAERAGDGERAIRELDKGLHSLKQSVHEARRLMNDLCPPSFDDTGLSGALERLLATEQTRAGWDVADLQHDLPTERLALAVETAIYRVAQEALANARKHAHALCVYVLLRVEPGPDAGISRLLIEVRDRGQGFDPELDLQESQGRGLRAMRERIHLLEGSIEIRSAPGEGTWIRACIPIRDTASTMPGETQGG